MPTASYLYREQDMTNDEKIVRYSAAEMRAMRERGESKTDLPRVRAKSKEELGRGVASDPDWAQMPRD